MRTDIVGRCRVPICGSFHVCILIDWGKSRYQRESFFYIWRRVLFITLMQISVCSSRLCNQNSSLPTKVTFFFFWKWIIIKRVRMWIGFSGLSTGCSYLRLCFFPYCRKFLGPKTPLFLSHFSFRTLRISSQLFHISGFRVMKYIAHVIVVGPSLRPL